MKKRKLYSLGIQMLMTLLIMFATTDLFAQAASSQVTLANDVVLNNYQVEFDLYVKGTPNANFPTGEFPYANGQFRINFNGAIRTTGANTQVFFEIIPGTSELTNTAQVNTTVTNPTLTQTFVRIPGELPGSLAAASYISPDGFGTKIFRMRMTLRNATTLAPVPFNEGTTPNLTLVTTSPGGCLTYNFQPAGTVILCVPNVLVNTNLVNLAPNSASPCTDPQVFNVTGGGDYCQGGAGMPVGLSGSQVGVNYTLMPGNVVMPGTGSPISFGNQLAGIYTVTGIGTVPEICANVVNMAGNAVVTETPASTVNVNASACDSYTWALNGQTYTESGDYTYVDGCVTTILHLTITPSSTVNVNAAACDTYTWALNGETYTMSGDYTYVDGCVTTILHLTITPSSTVNVNAAACDTYTWALNGETYTMSGDYTYVDGCVTTILHLTITPSSTVNVDAAACDSYTWALNGETYTMSGDYTYVDGCITTILHLTITPSGNNVYTESACDSYFWAVSGETYTVSGDYVFVNGCSTNTLHLTITPSSTVNVNAAACDTYTWALNGQTYTVSGDYTFVDGCVTTILHLTITNTITPAVGIVANANPVDAGTMVTFTATVTVGTPVQYSWTVNGIAAGSNNAVFAYIPVNGDLVQVQVMVSETCVTAPTANSNVIAMVVNPLIPTGAVWTGLANNGDWFTAGNWDTGVPGAITNVTIPGGLGDNYPMNAGVCNNLLVANGASLMVNPVVGGTATVQSLVTAGQYHFISSPVAAATAGSAFPLSTFMRKYDELQPSQQWVNIVAADVLTPFVGFSTFIPAATGDHTANYVGALNNGDFSNSGLTFTANSTASYDGYNLLGNPYASRINLEGGVTLSNVDNAIYFWNPAINNYSYWVIGGAGVNGASANVPVGQGFFVKVSAPGTGTFGISNAVRTNAVQPFYKSTLNNVIRLKAEGDIYTDETMVRFNEMASAQFDAQFDAYKLKASDVNHLYTKTADGSELAINALTSIEENTSIPVYFEVAHSGSYNLTASEIESIAGNVPVWLEDLKTGAVQNLRENAVYAFNADVNDNAFRFKLTFAVLGVDDKPLQNINIWSVNKTIHMQLPVVVKGSVRMTNAAGQTLINTDINAVGEYVINAPVAAGIYMVTITSDEGVVTKKVLIK